MLKVSCDSSNEIELERGFAAAAEVVTPEPGFFRSAAGRAHFGGVWEIGDWRSDIMNDRSYAILVPGIKEKYILK